MELVAQGDAFDGDLEGWGVGDHVCVLLFMTHVALAGFWLRCTWMTGWTD